MPSLIQTAFDYDLDLIDAHKKLLVDKEKSLELFFNFIDFSFQVIRETLDKDYQVLHNNFDELR